MNKEDAIYFAGLMEDYLHIPSFLCEIIEKNLINKKYKEVIEYIIQEIHLEDMYNHSEIKVIDIELQNKINEIIDYINKKESK